MSKKILIKKEILEDLYFNQNLSWSEVAKKLNVSTTTIKKRAKEYGIQSRSIGSRKRLDLTGQKFNRLTVLNFARIGSDKRTEWLCRCDCGKEVIRNGTQINKGHIKSCGCANLDPVVLGKMVGSIPQWYYSRCKYRAKKKQIEFNVSMEYLDSIYTKKCALSGLDIYLSPTKYENSESTTTASLDRIDSSKGYVEDNLQWIHKDINSMKLNIPEDKFIEYCHLISKKASHE